MNHLKIIFLVTAAFVLGVSAQEHAIKPASVYQQGGVTVVSPNQPNWMLMKSSKSETVFQKRLEDEVVNANVRTFQTKVFDNDKDLLISLEALKKEELSKLNRDSIHFNYVRFKGSPCLQYDGIFKVNPAGASSLEYLNLNGYLCRLPESKDLIVQMEFSNHSNSRGFSENLSKLSAEFFEKITFPKPASD